MNILFKSEAIEYLYLKNNNTKQTILFLHGWGGNKNSFSSTINLVKSKFNIISPTLPTIKNTNLSWTLEDYKNLVLSILKSHNISSAIIICHSFGFRVACLLKNFTCIEKLIVTGGAGPKKVGFIKKLKLQNNKILLSKPRFKNLYNYIASEDYKTLSRTNKQTFKNIVNLNTLNLIKFNCPLLLFWGKNDIETKPWIAKIIKKQNNAIYISTKSNHFAYLKLNPRFNHEVIKFLGGR